MPDAVNSLALPRLPQPAWLVPRDTGALLALGAVCLLAAGSLLTFAFDGPLSAWVASTLTPGSWARRVAKLTARLPIAPLYALLVVLALLAANRVRLMVGLAAAIGTTLALVHALKTIVGRARPDQELGPYAFHFLGDPRLGLDSFPSGHAAQAAMLAALVTLLAPRLGWLAWPIVAVTSWVRVAQGRHFVGDVLAGVLLGVVVVLLCRWMLGAACYRRLPRRGDPVDVRRVG